MQASWIRANISDIVVKLQRRSLPRLVLVFGPTDIY